MNITYNVASRDDLAQILGIELESFPAYNWTMGDFSRFIAKKAIYVAKEKKKVVGFIVFNDELDKFIHIENLAVHKGYRRIGIGTALVKAVLNLCSDVQAEVRETNLSAQLFFKKLGFTAFDIVKNHYDGSTEDCYVFTLYAGVLT